MERKVIDWPGGAWAVESRASGYTPIFKIASKAAEIIAQGNGFGVPRAALVELPEEFRAAVWAEILEQGKAESE